MTRGILFILGVVSEQTTRPAATPERKRWPLPMEVLVALQMSSTQQVTASVKFFDKAGNPARVEGTPDWSCDNTDLLALTPGQDGMSCLVAARGPLGVGKVTMTADADLGAGVSPLLGTLDIEITVGQASVVEITAGTPEEQAGGKKRSKN